MRSVAVAGGLIVLLAGCGAQSGIEVRAAVVAQPAGPATAMYFELVNNGDEVDRLLGARSDFGVIEVHRSFEEGGRMHMEPVSEVAVGGGEVVVFEPGGLHLMLLDVQSLEIDQTVTVTLEFEVAGDVEVNAAVKTYAEIAP